MPLPVDIGKETFLLQEFVQTGVATPLADQAREDSTGNCNFLGELRFVSHTFQA